MRIQNCKNCGIRITRFKTKANKKGKCRQKCDGIQRDKGGYPLNPTLRKEMVLRVTLKSKEHLKQKRILDKTIIIRKAGGQVIRKDNRIVLDKSFYLTRQWQELRYEALKKYERKCMVCFRSNTELHVDHIKPISKFPNFALELTNLQILCRDCNLGKGNKDTIDWRISSLLSPPPTV